MADLLDNPHAVLDGQVRDHPIIMTRSSVFHACIARAMTGSARAVRRGTAFASTRVSTRPLPFPHHVKRARLCFFTDALRSPRRISALGT
jgi:hypothetical protein